MNAPVQSSTNGLLLGREESKSHHFRVTSTCSSLAHASDVHSCAMLTVCRRVQIQWLPHYSSCPRVLTIPLCAVQ